MKTDYFTSLDILAAGLWLVIIIVIGVSIRSINNDKPHYKYYLPNLYAKLFFSLCFALFYILIGGGGDTVAYFDGALKLNNLFFKSPSLFIEEIVRTPNVARFATHYDAITGYPPGWIYKEPEAFFISKLMSFFSFFTLKSYFAMTFIMSFFTASASWRLYEFLKGYKINNEKLLVLGILLLPSVNFWCAGISKDTVSYICILVLAVNCFKIMSEERKSGLKNVIIIIITSYVLISVRSFIFFAFAIPFLFVYVGKLIRYFGGNSFMVIIFRTLIISSGIILASLSFLNQSEAEFVESNALVQEASVIQNDFSNNTTYGDKKYDLGITDFSPVGLVAVAPLTIVTGIFRPFIWESFNLTLIMNGLESLLLLYLTFLFFRRGVFKKIKKISRHDFLIFSVLFVLFMAYMTGLTSILYGVLVRLRAPLLPFLIVLLSVDWDLISLAPKKDK